MKLSLVATALLALTSTVAMAQNINQRKVDQQVRIAHGVRSGQLTARETAHLERHAASINRQEYRMRRADNGRLTRFDRASLNRRQNHLSRSIYRDMHNSFHRG